MLLCRSTTILILLRLINARRLGLWFHHSLLLYHRYRLLSPQTVCLHHPGVQSLFHLILSLVNDASTVVSFCRKSLELPFQDCSSDRDHFADVESDRVALTSVTVTAICIGLKHGRRSICNPWNAPSFTSTGVLPMAFCILPLVWPTPLAWQILTQTVTSNLGKKRWSIDSLDAPMHNYCLCGCISYTCCVNETL